LKTRGEIGATSNNVDSTLNQRRIEEGGSNPGSIPLIPDSLIPDSLIPDSLNPEGKPPPRTTDGEGGGLPPLPDEPKSIADLSNYLTRRGMEPQALAMPKARTTLGEWIADGMTWKRLDAAFTEAERTLKGSPPSTPATSTPSSNA
jgi:hypothetical protein